MWLWLGLNGCGLPQDHGEYISIGLLPHPWHRPKVLGDRLRVVDELQVYAGTMELGAIVHGIGYISEYAIQ